MSNDTYALLSWPLTHMLGMINSFSGNRIDIHGHYVLDLWLQNQ